MTNGIYIDSKHIISILESIMKKNIEDIKNDLENKKITITDDEIRKYLNKVFEEEKPELKKRIETQKVKQGVVDLLTVTNEQIKESTQRFIDDIESKRYKFEPYTLKYYKKYTTIVRQKALLLISLIEAIGSKNTINFDKLLKSIDITLDENGNILKDDIYRLIEPTIYNINKLNKKVDEANNLETYLNNKLSLYQIYKNGMTEDELYPSKSIQIHNLYYSDLDGNVALSENQKKNLQEEESKRIKLVINLFD